MILAASSSAAGPMLANALQRERHFGGWFQAQELDRQEGADLSMPYLSAKIT
jgi:hypothetical protein